MPVTPLNFLYTLIDLTLSQKDYSASVLAVFDRFGVQFDKLNEGNIHSLWNVMTLVQPIHDSFDRLELWFEATVSILLYALTVFSSFVLRAMSTNISSKQLMKPTGYCQN